ncbi:Flp family type IVb pilin [Nocardioides plantarum]|uniref:Flp family type IVb pilin n=1 Tax=Nocardioides plantarum TaxID=29299 RepID=A0ABV5KCL2_9ACTN|nr:Flp family type IVb pilin [Nocardioides plantarum]
MLAYARILLQARLAVRHERGVSAVDYGLLVTGIAAVVVLVAVAFGGDILDALTDG